MAFPYGPAGPNAPRVPSSLAQPPPKLGKSPAQSCSIFGAWVVTVGKRARGESAWVRHIPGRVPAIGTMLWARTHTGAAAVPAPSHSAAILVAPLTALHYHKVIHQEPRGEEKHSYFCTRAKDGPGMSLALRPEEIIRNRIYWKECIVPSSVLHSLPLKSFSNSVSHLC